MFHKSKFKTPVISTQFNVSSGHHNFFFFFAGKGITIHCRDSKQIYSS